MTPATREKIANLKSRLSKKGKATAAGMKGSAIAVATGGVAYELEINALNKVDYLVDPANWYAKPLVLAVAGHFLRRKSQTAGIALLGAAGYAGAKAFEDRPKEGATEGISRTWSEAGALTDSIYARRTRASMGSGGASPMYGEPVAEAAEATPTYHDAGTVMGQRWENY